MPRVAAPAALIGRLCRGIACWRVVSSSVQACRFPIVDRERSASFVDGHSDASRRRLGSRTRHDGHGRAGPRRFNKTLGSAALLMPRRGGQDAQEVLDQSRGASRCRSRRFERESAWLARPWRGCDGRPGQLRDLPAARHFFGPTGGHHGKWAEPWSTSRRYRKESPAQFRALPNGRGSRAHFSVDRKGFPAVVFAQITRKSAFRTQIQVAQGTSAAYRPSRRTTAFIWSIVSSGPGCCAWRRTR